MADRLFRFFQWNDFHIRNPNVTRRNHGYPRCNEKAAWAVACARGETEVEPPDFVASVGDLVCGEIDDYADDFRFLKSHLLDRLRVPLLPCLGNHENRQGEGLPELNAAYDTFYGPRWHNYVYTVAGFAFIVVDTSSGHREADAVTAGRNGFLARSIDRFGEMPVWVLTHVPLVPMRDEQALKPSFGFSSWKVQDPGLLDLVESNADRVVAVLCGHIHLTGHARVRGVHHVMPSGTAGYPADFAAVDVYADRVEIEMVAAPALIGSPPEGDIHGTARHGIDYVDSTHPDHASYLTGNPSERRVVIPLDGHRVPASSAATALQIFHERSPGEWVEAGLPRSAAG